jgi:crotonobetainyl-CoA:carnitine CoA-transferase CaiB-like acyl-CoA transferase
MKVGVALADVLAGKDAAVAILAALAARGGSAHTGHVPAHDVSPGDVPAGDVPVGDVSAGDGPGRDVAARRLHVSLAHSATSALVNVAQNVLVTGKDASRWGNAHPNLCPYQLFETADRPIALGVGTDAHWAATASVLGLEDLAADESLRTNAGRVTQRDRVVGAVARALAQYHASHWLEKLRNARVPVGYVRTPREALAGVEASAVTGVHPLPPAAIRFPPPLLDEHGPLIRARGWAAFA